MRGSLDRMWLAIAWASLLAIPVPGRAQRAAERRSRWRAPLGAGATFGLAALTELGRANGRDGTTAGWRSTRPFYKTYAHGVAAFALADVGVDMGLAPWRSASVVCGAGAVYELVQGYVSRWDIAADCVGGALDALLRSAVHAPRGPPHPVLFVSGVAAGLAIVKLGGIDRDPGGYHDRFASVARFNLVAMRATSAFAVTRVGTNLGLSPWTAAATACAAGMLLAPRGPTRAIALEGTCLGAGASALWSVLRHPR